MNGGISDANPLLDLVHERQRTSQQLDENLRILRIKFDAFPKDDLDKKLEFIDKLGYTTLVMWHDQMLFKLEKLLADMLLAKQE
jgi:ABC-type Na+ efflux pump permease subunit